MTSETSANPERPIGAWPVSAYQRDVLGLAFRLAPEPVAQQTYSLRMDEPLDIERLQACWQRALMSDDALRLRFAFENGEFRQWISNEIPPVEVIDLTGAPDPEAATQEWLWREVGAPERPDRPARLAAVVDRPDRFFLFMSFHHALADGYGMNPVIATLDTSYKMKDVPLEQLAVPEPANEHTDRSVATYRRIIEDDEAYRTSEQYTADRDGLLAALDGVEPALFPNRTSSPRIARGHYNTMISGQYLDRVRVTGVTVFAYLTAAVATYLATIHRTDQVVIGVPMLNRHSAETYRTQGHRANVVPLPVRVDRDVPLLRIAEQVTQQIRKLKKHQRFPYGELTRALNPDPAAPPLYDVAFSHTKLPDADYVHELISKWTVHNPGSVTNALTIVTAENGRDGSFSLQLFYDKDIFDASFPIESALRSVGEMVTASLDDPETPVGALPLLSAQASAEVAAFEAGPRIEFPYTTIDRLFTEKAADHPDRVAVVSADSRELTYARLSGLVDGFAARLHELGATGNECIPVVLPRSTDMLIAVLGILRAGCAYMPLDPDYPAARIETVLADCEARFVVAGSEHARVYRDLGITPITVADTVRGTVENVSHPHDLSYLIYTSGSTGVPKGVMVEHRSVVNRLTWMQRRYPLLADDVILQKTPVTFDVSVWELFWWAITGAKVALLEVGGERDPRRIAEAIEANAVTVVHFVPSMLAAFVDELEADRTIVPRIASLRRVFCSGEALPPALVRRFHVAFAAVAQRPPQLVNLYGPTEATVDVSYFDCPQGDSLDLVPIGRPIDNIDLLVLDESGRRMPIGVPGELNIAGVGLARGYRGRRDLTAAAFVDDLTVPGRRRYRTGDLARWLADGSLEYLGRFDDQVKIRGNRITLGEVQNAILGCAGVRAAVVVDEQSETHGLHLVGYFVGDAVTGDEIADQIALRLPRYMIPTRLLRVDRIPLTPNGKADRKALARAAAVSEHAEFVGVPVEPRTPVEAELAQVWRTVLGIDSIGVHDNFFTHGGDSILALSVRTSAERAGLFFDVDAFYEHPTIAELARIVSDGPDGNRIRIADPLATVPLIDRAALHQAEDAFPATALQLGMLFHSIERTDSATYKDVFRYRFEMPWNAAQFRAAFDRLVRRQPALRSSFELSRYSVPLQVVHTAIEYEMDIVDVSDLDPVLADQDVEDYTRERRHARYDLARAPLHAVRVFLQPSEGTLQTVDLVLSFHHAILDGWSVATSVLELLVDYLNKLGLIETGIDDTPHAATVLAEYAQSEIAAVHDDSAREFWREALAGAEPTALTALGVHEGAGAQDPQAAALVPRRLAERVTAFAARHQVPEKVVYLAAHCLTLRTVTGRTDITTGVVSHGRPDRAGAESVAGLFLNTLPMRLDDTATTWRTAVEQIARRDRDAYPHRRYPLRSILADGGPAFETAFNFINYHVFAPILGTDRVTLRDFDVREDTNFQLLVTVAHDPRDGRMWVRVNGDHTLTKDQCETVAVTQLRMLAAIVADPDAAIDRGTGPATARDIGTLVADAAALNPHTIAVQGDESSLTYDELIERSERLARWLHGLGVGPGDRIGILMSRRPELVLLVLALMRMGAACVPLDVSYPRARLNLMIDRARPHRVIADAAYAEIVDNVRLVLDTAEVFDPTADSGTEFAVPDYLSPDALAYVLFTSGSTGEPKGVAMPHRGLSTLVDWQNRSPSGMNLASTLQLAPLSFDVSFQEIFTTLAAGSTLRVSSADLRANVEELLNTVISEGIERLFLPYVALQAFAEAVVARRKFPVDLKVLASSGEQLRITDEIRALCKVVPGLLLENQYGPTESHVATVFTLAGSPDDYPALPPIGRPVDGDTVELLDSALRPVTDGVIGEIYLGGRSLARGYQGRAALTAQRFVATHGGGILYRTGDLGVRLASGDLVCLGRSDSQVKIRGFRVEPAEVELCILGLVEKYPAITEAAVVARGFGGIDGALIAFLVGDAEQTDLAALRHDLRGVLPAHMVPSRFVFLDELPRTPSGKRDDGALRSIVESAPESITAQREPADEYEHSAVELLAEYAGLRSIGLDDDFFAAGGTSIGAMRVVMGLSRRFGAEIPLDLFIGAPTAAQLAALIRSGNTRRTFDPLVPITVGGHKPPLFLVHPIGGNVLCYLTLARYLDPDRAIYGLQAAGADAGSTPEKTIVGMAESYLAAVRRVHPEGPYHLAGWSFGGNVALEMARQLPEWEVASVTLLDTMALRQQAREPIAEEQLIRWFFLELLWYARGNQAALVDFEPGVHGSEELFDAMLAEAIRSGILPADSSPQAIRRLYEVFYANYTALLEYQLEPYDRDITLLRAEEGLPPGVDLAHQAVGSMFDSANNGWQQYAARRFTLVPVPGDHLHMMTEPHVREVAVQLDSALAAADPDPDRELGAEMLDA